MLVRTKREVARPLAQLLEAEELTVWLDEQTLTLGDSLSDKIGKGLSKCRFGLVVISPAFVNKFWTKKELNALFSREQSGNKVILPLWHEINKEEVADAFPLLADRLSVSTSAGLKAVVREVLKVVKPDKDFKRTYKFEDILNPNLVISLNEITYIQQKS